MPIELSSDEKSLRDVSIQVPLPRGTDHDIAVLSDRDAAEILPYEADDSPFPEVRAAVQPKDDVLLPINTVRMWIIGLLFTVVGSGLNQFFSLRQPSVTISALVAQLAAYPVGCAWARWMPLGRLNPDRHFNIKEHALVTIMANVSFGSAAATQVIEAMVKFYGMPSKGGFEILFTITTQLFGLGLAGMASRWLVGPATMIWPQVLSNAALLSTLHSRSNILADGWIISRLRFFLLVLFAGAIWYFVPGYLFTALSTFSFICWIAPTNVVLNQLFGQRTGLGMSVFTFDWAQVVFANQSPLLVPFWAGCNVMGSFVLFFWIICPILYYTNTWYSAYLPLLNPNTFDNKGQPYKVNRVMNPDGSVNAEAYRSYSPMFLPAGYAVTYGVAFANLTGIFVHIGLYHWKDLWEQWKGRNKKDIHSRLMQSYVEVPWWWFGVVTLLMFVLSIVTNEVWHTGLPAWAVLLAYLLPAVYFIPIGIIKAVTNISSNQLNLITEFIGGYAFLGRPVANMAFKFYGYVAVSQGLEFVADMKLAHYLHIPPRILFLAQGLATLIGAAVQCGALGPARNFSSGEIYGNLLWFFLVGPVVVVITYLLGRRWKQFSYVSWPVAFGAMSQVPPATGISFSSWWIVNSIFNGIIKRRKPAWWAKYNYVLSAALDSGVAVATVVIFFCIILPAGTLHWWGNEVFKQTADGMGTPWKKLPESGFFGPEIGTWQ
ncbi:hypothetical protein EYZ11_009996 [Aspergillus tanneri]|uniref:Oligopeptide transporter n=1 Tax=Aspergillus tanneri TaxID=1220188 RepID=A0A4S3J6F9_9EURO|nr:hypothetical protein EYZ11_009996 [Aspergillus tanneri]